MRSIKFNLSLTNATNAWEMAVKVTEAYLTQNIKANQLLDSFSAGFSDRERASCQALFLGALRHGHHIDHALQTLVKRNPHARLKAIFLVTGYEMLSESLEKIPKIIHHAVERSKTFITKSQTGMLNAVLRKLPDALDTVHPDNRPDVYFSHPKWLFKRWNKAFGLQKTLRLMQWNQDIPATYIKLYNDLETIPEGLEPTKWNLFYKISKDASWKKDIYPLLKTGSAYIKDPSTRLAPALLAPKCGEKVLDLCAAPGGKAYDMAHLMQFKGQIVAVDLPGIRIKRLSENLELIKHPSFQSSIIEEDVLKLTDNVFTNCQLPLLYDAVMLDAPCSNTGVIRRRTDVKWRLKPNDIENCSCLQKELLATASTFVNSGGRIVYSTCSIEAEENQFVVDAFLKSEAGQRFTLKENAISLPWETGHDGAGAFLLIAK